MNDLAAAGVGFKSLTEGIDTTTPAGRLTFHLFGALAEFERELIRERTAAGLAAARARGRSGGRPRAMTPEKLAVARQMYESRGHTLAAIAATVGVSRSTLYRYLGDQGRPELSSLKSREETGAKRGSRPPLGGSCRAGSYHTVGTRPDLVIRLSLVTRGSARTLAVATISRSHGSGTADQVRSSSTQKRQRSVKFKGQRPRPSTERLPPVDRARWQPEPELVV